METFFKLMPSEMIESHNNQEGLTILKNGSQVYWKHLDNADENALRGLEINSFLGDQAEEFEEKTMLVVNSRVGRWDNAVVPQSLIDQFPGWPQNSLTGKYLAPSYCMLLCNPDTQFHFIYRKYHPESLEKDPGNYFVEGQWDTQLGSREAYEQALKNDPEWVDKYVRGKWGISAASIHFVSPSCILEPTTPLLERIREKGNLFRVLDHGDSAPTVCLWFAALDGVFICYREYYVPGRVISYHRQAIADLSGQEQYSGNYADPSIFNKNRQKDNEFSTIAMEYKDTAIKAPAIHWKPADNNEFATRNRINELLTTSDNYVNPVTKIRPAPGIFFVKKTTDYPHGCTEAPKQLGQQRREVIGSIDGKTIYSDDRDASITDHAYDCVRYFVAIHGTNPSKVRKAASPMSFAYYAQLAERARSAAPTAGSAA